MKRLAIVLGMALAAAGCIETHVVVDQPKPLEINIKFSGNLNLVIQDARQDLEKVTGEKPTNVVRPEDIGLPAAGKGGAISPVENRDIAVSDEPTWMPVAFKMGGGVREEGRLFTVALKDDLQTAMAARNKQIQALWDSKAVGEAHTGLLVVKGTLTADQQKVVNAENADRAALYADEAKTKKTTADESALGYYVARLGYARKGAWYEVRNAKGDWEWKQWGG